MADQQFCIYCGSPGLDYPYRSGYTSTQSLSSMPLTESRRPKCGGGLLAGLTACFRRGAKPGTASHFAPGVQVCNETVVGGVSSPAYRRRQSTLPYTLTLTSISCSTSGGDYRRSPPPPPPPLLPARSSDSLYSLPYTLNESGGSYATTPCFLMTVDECDDPQLTRDGAHNKSVTFQPEAVMFTSPAERVAADYGGCLRPPRIALLQHAQRASVEGKYGLLLPPNQGPTKVLLVFVRDDPVSDTLWRASEKLGFEVSQSRAYENALEEFCIKTHDLVIVDMRSSKHFDGDTLCRSIRNTKGSQHTVVAAVIRRSVMEKDETIVAQMLETGFNRCMIESASLSMCTNELLQLKTSEVRPYAQFTTSQALYAAMDRSRDLMYITDNTHRIQYINRAAERVLQYRQDELIGKCLLDYLSGGDSITLLQSMNQNLARGRDWEGAVCVRRKNAELVALYTKAVPICCYGRLPTHFVFVQDAGNLVLDWPTLSATNLSTATAAASAAAAAGATVSSGTGIVAADRPRGSVNSLRRGSFDVRSIGSDGIRRTSLAKLHSLPLEAPITKAITLITNLQEVLPPPQAQTLDRIIDLIRTNELYSPQMKEEYRLRNDDPVTSDLIGALLSQGPSHVLSSRRSSNDSSVVRSTVSRINASRHRAPVALRELLETALHWEFDIFRLEELTNKRPLVHLGMNLMIHFDVPGTLNCDEKTLQNWLTVIESNYRTANTYHNSTHAADVLQATAGYLEKERMQSIMDPLDNATSLIAAAAHDVDHPGKSSAFLCNSDSPLAILYNDLTVLENHHAAHMFKLTVGDDRVNIFKNLDRDQYKVARHNVIDMILATEMTKHFEHLAKFVNVFCSRSLSREEMTTSESETDMSPLTLPENITLVKRMMIKCADVSNPTRPMRLCVEWARRIAEEYFSQTDEEKAANLPVVMPMFDRTTCSIPKSQIGFVDYIINDMVEAWDAFIDMPELVTYMRQNYLHWKEYDEQGLSTLGDIKKLQTSPHMCPMLPL